MLNAEVKESLDNKPDKIHMLRNSKARCMI